MRRGAAICIHDDFAPSEARISIRPADHKLTCRVHMPMRVTINPAIGQRFADIWLNNGAHVFRGHLGVQMLR